ncbi:MAG: cryptochrome/photolyase family protein [Bacteroidota bacterium]
MQKTRNLILILGDQLDPQGPSLEGADPTQDVVVMAEVASEIERYPNHKQRVVLFLAAMRHFKEDLIARGFRVIYQHLDANAPAPDLPAFLGAQIVRWQPEGVVLTTPGRHDLTVALTNEAEQAGIPLDMRPDTHFFCSKESFSVWAQGRKSLVMEYFYRDMRKQYGYLMQGSKPVGGTWNYDKENRGTFSKNGPQNLPPSTVYSPDAITQAVCQSVEQHFPNLYGSTEAFGWPVTPTDAHAALDDFIENRLPHFGTYQDAMWTDEPFLYHARLAAALNLKLINPRTVCDRAVAAYAAGAAPLNAVEGFIRQVLGWREFIRGVYWHHMPAYINHNALQANNPLPDLFWTGNTRMRCMQQVVQQLLQYGYAHHIQRLMVSGLFALLYRAEPAAVQTWFMAMYVDAVEWVTLPNTIGMSQYADGGVVGTKPYIATGKYIKRMSNYCKGCAYNPDLATGPEACPFTTLYWDFLMEHEATLGSNRRMGFQLKNLQRKSHAQREAIAERATVVHELAQTGAL